MKNLRRRSARKRLSPKRAGVGERIGFAV